MTHYLSVDPELPRALSKHLQDCDCGDPHARAVSHLERMASEIEGGEVLSRGELKANVASLWKLMAESFYKGGDLPALATRECLQNSVDAIRSAYAKGVLPKGTGVFSVDVLDGGATLVFADNGIGMDEATLADVFLRLAATGKAGDPNAAGGFGAAKAVILGASETQDWEVWSRDRIARSTGGIKFDILSAPMRKGVQITLRGVNTALVYDRIQKKDVELEERVRYMLELSNIPDITLSLNGYVVEPLFPARRGSILPEIEQMNWGPETTVRVKSYQRKAGAGGGGFYVRLNGLYQFADRPSQSLSFDVTFDVSTKLRPQVSQPPYPFTAARDSFSDRSWAANTYWEARDQIVREAVSSATPREYDTLIGDASDPREREGAELLAKEMAGIMEDPSVKAALEQLMGAAEAIYAAEKKQQRAPAAAAAGEEDDAPALSGPDPYAGFRAAMAPVDVATADGREALAGGILSLVSVEHLSPEAVEGVRALEAGASPSGEAVLQILQAVNKAPEVAASDVNRTNESPVAIASAAADVAQAIGRLAVQGTAEVKAQIEAERQVSPFGSAAMVKISRLHFEKAEAKKFLKNAGKYLPLLAVWDIILRAIATESKISSRITFRPGFVLNDTVRGVCVSEGEVGRSVRNFILLHPHAGPMAVYYTRGGPAKIKPQQIAAYLHGVACHELAHLPIIGRGGKPHGHDEQWAEEREDLSVASSHLLPGIEQAVRVAMFPGQAGALPPVGDCKKVERELEKVRGRLRSLAVSKEPKHELAVKVDHLATYSAFRTFLRKAPQVFGAHTGAQILDLMDRHPEAVAAVLVGAASSAPRMEHFAMPDVVRRAAQRQGEFNRGAVAAATGTLSRSLGVQACIARCLEASARRRYLKGSPAPGPVPHRAESFGPVVAAAGQLALNEGSAIASDAAGCMAGCIADYGVESLEAGGFTRG